MGIFDELTVDYPPFPVPSGVIFQAYVNIADSYGDFYKVDRDGQLHRLTFGACMSRARITTATFALDYTDPRLEVLADEQAFYLSFEAGRLTGWRRHDEYGFDQMTIHYAPFPYGPDLIFQGRFAIADSYDDFYRVDANGQLWRLTRGAWMEPARGVLKPPERLDYTDPAVKVYDGPEGAHAYILTFEHGRLIDWRLNEWQEDT